MSNTRLVVSFNTIANLCEDLELPLSASELHGFICGILAVSDDKKMAQAAIETILSENADHETELTTELHDFISDTLQQLADPNFGFQLLLPEQEDSLAQRTAALGHWTQGFVSGLGEGGMQLSSNDHDELNEIITDLTSIAQVDTDNIGDSEEEQAALTELEEYLRVAAITIYTDLLLQDKNKVEPKKTGLLH